MAGIQTTASHNIIIYKLTTHIVLCTEHYRYRWMRGGRKREDLTSATVRVY